MNLRESKAKNPKWIHEKSKQRMPNGFEKIHKKESEMDFRESKSKTPSWI